MFLSENANECKTAIGDPYLPVQATSAQNRQPGDHAGPGATLPALRH
jgi:hypothetical protein